MRQSQPDQRLIGEMLRNPNAARARYVEQGLTAAGHTAIRQPHLPVFEYVDRVRGSRITYLAAHADITVQAMGELVDYLVRHGYAERVPDPTDGRAKLVRLTAQGLAIYVLAGRLVREIEATWASYIGARKFGQLKKLLAELWDAIEADEEKKLADLHNRAV